MSKGPLNTSTLKYTQNSCEWRKCICLYLVFSFRYVAYTMSTYKLKTGQFLSSIHGHELNESLRSTH